MDIPYISPHILFSRRQKKLANLVLPTLFSRAMRRASGLLANKRGTSTQEQCGKEAQKAYAHGAEIESHATCERHRLQHVNHRR